MWSPLVVKASGHLPSLFKHRLLLYALSNRGPMSDGISPREASDRLNFFMVRFDDLWRKYVTYSGGEQLFGLEVTEYQELQRVRKELNLLQKLYGLYNDVLEKVGGYYDTPWHDIDIDVINTELIDFQNKSVAAKAVNKYLFRGCFSLIASVPFFFSHSSPFSTTKWLRERVWWLHMSS